MTNSDQPHRDTSGTNPSVDFSVCGMPLPAMIGEEAAEAESQWWVLVDECLADLDEG